MKILLECLIFTLLMFIVFVSCEEDVIFQKYQLEKTTQLTCKQEYIDYMIYEMKAEGDFGGAAVGVTTILDKLNDMSDKIFVDSVYYRCWEGAKESYNRKGYKYIITVGHVMYFVKR